jgi:hypothetical protein
MSRPRKSIEEIMAAGNPSKLTTAQLAQRAAEEKAPLTIEQRTELQRLDDLIAKAMRACEHGQTHRGRRNPAYANLALLMKLRSHVLTQKRPPKSGEDILKEAEELFKVN